MLMGHTDVVPAPAAGWTVPPFEGVVRDGPADRPRRRRHEGRACRPRGRARRVRAQRRAPAGDVVLVAESDEERNTADVGMSWLVRERPDLRCDYALNEGGGVLLELADGRRVVTVVGRGEAGRRRCASGSSERAGHASVPAARRQPAALSRPPPSSGCSRDEPPAAARAGARSARCVCSARRRRRRRGGRAGPASSTRCWRTRCRR